MISTEYNNWLSYAVPFEWEAEAKKIRRQRDEMYGNIFTEMGTDLRWVGDLGEICFNHWLKENDINDFHWYLDESAGKPDFVIGGQRIDIKTVKRRVAPRPYYTAQITAQHKDHPIDELFFLSFEFPRKKLWLLGGIKMTEFLKFARYYGAGEMVHNDYVIREGHEIYNAELSILDSPLTWIKKFKNQ